MAVLITWEDVVATMKSRPEVEHFDQHSQDLVFEEVVLRVNSTAFPGDERGQIGAKTAQRLLACHIADFSLQNGAGEGSVANESIGGISIARTMAVNNPTAADNIRATHYGRRYIDEILPIFFARGAVG